MRRVIYFYFYFFSPNEQRAGGGGGALLDFFFFFPCSADHERDWPPCKVVFSKALHGRLKSQRDGTVGKLTFDPPFSFRRERGTGKRKFLAGRDGTVFF